jgi:hypothetical protein
MQDLLISGFGNFHLSGKAGTLRPEKLKLGAKINEWPPYYWRNKPGTAMPRICNNEIHAFGGSLAKQLFLRVLNINLHWNY